MNRGFHDDSVGKEFACNAEDTRDAGLIPGSGRSLEEEMTTHSRIPTWKVPWREEPDGLQSKSSKRVGSDWVYTHTHTHTHTQTRWTDYQKYPCFSLKNEITLHISLRDTDFFLHKQLLHFTKRGKKTKRYRKGYKPKKFPRSSIWYRHRTKWVYHAKQSIDSMQSPSGYQWYFSQN